MSDLERCRDCGHAVESHDLRGWSSDSVCKTQCQVCAAAEAGDRTYVQAMRDASWQDATMSHDTDHDGLRASQLDGWYCDVCAPKAV